MGCGQSKIGNIYPRKSKNKGSNKRSAREDQLKAISKHMRQHRDRDQQVHAFEILDQPEILYPEGEEEELADINMSNEQFQRAQQAMNIDQRQLSNFITESIKDQINGDKKRERILINGGAGAGKTVLFNLLKNQVNRCYGKVVVKFGALTGVAARLVGGSTLHRLLKSPMQKDGVIINMPLLSGVEADSEEDNDDADGVTQTDDVDSTSRERQLVSTGPLLVQTEMSTSQMDFFKMLDEKIESGPDYDSANEEEMALERARLCALLRDWDAASQGNRSPARNHYRQQNGELRYNSIVQYRGGTSYTELA